MQSAIGNAIEKLYEAFTNVPKPKTIAGCPCCIEGKKIDVLLSKPLREITADELSSYAFSLFNTVGSEADFKYFLPRIWDLLVGDWFFYVDPEVILGKLSYVRWQEWEENQRFAIENFIESAFASFVLRTTKIDCDFHHDRDSWLCASAHTGIAMEPLLKRIEQHPPAFIDLYEHNSLPIAEGKLANSFWQNIPDIHQEVIDWFKS